MRRAQPSRLTVARLREQREHVDVMFYESARIYHVPRTHPAFPTVLATLEYAHREQHAVLVHFDQADDSVVAAVE